MKGAPPFYRAVDQGLGRGSCMPGGMWDPGLDLSLCGATCLLAPTGWFSWDNVASEASSCRSEGSEVVAAKGHTENK